MKKMTGADVVVRSLVDHGVQHVFGYPGGSVLPIYDALLEVPELKHVLVRHEQGAVHMAQGYARASGKLGVILVTSGPGVTNTVTGLTDAYLDSTPLLCITGQVATPFIGTDGFQECDTVGITRASTKHNYLVTNAQELPRILHEAITLATAGRPGPVLVDIPKDVALAEVDYCEPQEFAPARAKPLPDIEDAADAAVALMATARRPLIYVGGGAISSGSRAITALRQLAAMTNYPVTSTLMGLGAFPASNPQWLGMCGLHGTYEANMAMHGCDLMICVGARFDDRVTGRVDGFSPLSRKIHIDIDPSSIGKIIDVDVPIVADCADALVALVRRQSEHRDIDGQRLDAWQSKIAAWRAVNSLGYEPSTTVIKPQYAIQRLYQAVEGRDVFITTEVGQHQMWAAQHFHVDEPRRFITSGGLGTMGFGFPAAIGAQVAKPGSLVIDIAGEASIQMTMKELGTAIQHSLPVKAFILNNRRLGMVRQQQDLFHQGRRSQSYHASIPDFVKFAESFGAMGIRCSDPETLDDSIHQMIRHDGPVFLDCLVDGEENCLPMIKSGEAHNCMLLAAASA